MAVQYDAKGHQPTSLVTSSGVMVYDLNPTVFAALAYVYLNDALHPGH